MKTTISILLALVGLLSSGDASATHKAWVLKNGGADCSFWSPGAEEYNAGLIVNTTSSARTAICPVALSGRWGSSSEPVMAVPRWGAAMSANVYTRKGTTGSNTFYCYAAMQTDAEEVHFSHTVYAANGTGAQRITVASQNNWGSSYGLELNESLPARSLDFVCVIPGTSSFGQSSIHGYKVKICQTNTGCYDGNTDHDSGVDSRDGSTYVQNSGIECSPQESWDVPNVTRSFDGLRSSGTGSATMFCPILAPADDSYEHNRSTTTTRVYYKGGSTNSSCVTSRTCPQCYLQWWDRSGGIYQSQVFAVSAGSGYVAQVSGTGGAHDPTLMGTETALGVICFVPSGVTINGTTAIMSLTGISGGI